MNHQLGSMVVAGNLAAEKRGSAGGWEVKAGSCAQAFYCLTFLMALFAEFVICSRFGCNFLVIAIA